MTAEKCPRDHTGFLSKKAGILCALIASVVFVEPSFASEKLKSYELMFGKSEAMCIAAENDLNRNLKDKFYTPFTEAPFAQPKWRKVKIYWKRGDRLGIAASGYYALFDIDNDDSNDHVLWHFTYPNRTVAENYSLFDSKELVDNRTVVIERETIVERSQLRSSGPYRIDWRLLDRDNPGVAVYNATTFYLGSLALRSFFYNDVSYIVLKKMYADKPNPDSSWLIIGRYSKEKLDKESLFNYATIIPDCYFRGSFG